MIIEGAISVKAAISSNKREINLVYIQSDKKTKDFNYIRKICKQNNIKIQECDNGLLQTIASGKTFGGICADVSTRKEDIFTDDDVFYLDGIEDPFNLGYAMRTLYAFGIKNVLLSSRDYSNMESQLIKSSAGAYEYLNIKVAKNSLKEIIELKNNGYYIYSLYRGNDSKDIFNVSFNKKTLFMLGGEKRGISSELLELSNECLYIPYGSDFRNSLNACAALDVVATLLFAQRKK